MLASLTRHWYVAALRGVLAILFGVAAFVSPAATLEVLVLLFGAYALVDGVSTLVLGLMAAGEKERWVAPVLSGLVGIATGVVTFVQPRTTALAIVYLIAAWAIVTGGLQIAAAVRLRKVITGEWLVALSGVLSIVFGGLLIAAPASGALTLVLLFGFYAIGAGISQVAFGFRLRGLGERFPRRPLDRLGRALGQPGDGPHLAS
jgi:uncharacterized membrane protein HdeD (DUF308 family)